MLRQEIRQAAGAAADVAYRLELMVGPPDPLEIQRAWQDLQSVVDQLKNIQQKAKREA